jgi:hypothetical protein
MSGKDKTAAKSSRPAHPENTPLAISSFKQTLILSSATPLQKGVQGGLSEVCSKMPSCRITGL